MTGNVAVSKLSLIMPARESVISLTQSFKSLTGTLSFLLVKSMQIKEQKQKIENRNYQHR